jgi:hypothetical protein
VALHAERVPAPLAWILAAAGTAGLIAAVFSRRQ